MSAIQAVMPANAQPASRPSPSPARGRLVVWLLIAASYAAGASAMDGAWRFAFVFAGLLAAFAIGAWTQARRARSAAPPPAPETPVFASAPPGEESRGDGLAATASRVEQETSIWEARIRAWEESRLLLRAGVFPFAPPSVCSEHVELLERAGGRMETSRWSVSELREIEEAERFARILLESRMPPQVVCLLPVGLIGKMGEARPSLPEWHRALERSKLLWIGERRPVPLGGDLYYFPIVAAFQIRHQTPASSSVAPEKRRGSRLYIGTDSNGELSFLDWPWHILVIGRSGSGKTNSLRHLLVEAVTVARRMRMSLLAVVTTAKDDGMAGVLRCSWPSDPRWIPLERKRAIRLAMRLDPSRSGNRIRILVVDEAQVLLAENPDLLQKVQRAAELGRQNRFAVFLGSSNVRSEILPIAITQHASWLIHSTDPNEATLLLRRAGVQIHNSDHPRRPGEAIYVPRDRSVRFVNVPLSSWSEVIKCAS